MKGKLSKLLLAMATVAFAAALAIPAMVFAADGLGASNGLNAAKGDDDSVVYAIPEGTEYTTVSNSEELKAALNDKAAVILLEDGEYNWSGTGHNGTAQTVSIYGESKNAILYHTLEGEGGTDYDFDGYTVNFYGLTISGEKNGVSYPGWARMSATYNDCVIKQTYGLYAGTHEFNYCTLNVTGDQYNVWTWGAENAAFNHCTFNSDGKAVLLYGQANTNLTVNSCVFNDSGALTSKKAAVEIGSGYGKSYTLTVNNTTVNGYEINDEGINTGTTLWANKNSMSSEKLTVVVDEKQVYPAVAAKVGDKSYETLSEAVGAANAAVDGDGNIAPATVTLLEDVTLGEKLTISGNVTITGEHTITRDDAYTGTLFAVNAGAALTLDGGLTIDGANNYAFGSELYAADLADWENPTASADNAKWFTPEEGAPVATAYMITTSGTVNLNDVAIKNHYSTNGSGIVSASKGASVTLDGAQITHNASTSGSGLVVNASAGVWSREEELITVTMNEGTVIDGNHVGGNHGVFKIYRGTYFTMNGGEVKNTTGWNSNGVAVGIYHAVFTMNGGTICSNSSEYGPNNGRNAAIYGHSNHLFTMNGGTVCHNTGRSKAGIDSPYSDTGYTGQTFINGGTVLDNTILGTWAEPDVSGGATLTITGGTFTQDVSQWLAPGYGLPYDEATGTYTVEDEMLVEVDGKYTYPSIGEAVKNMPSGGTIKVLASHSFSEPVVLGKDFVIDLNGEAVYVKGSEEGDGAFVVADGASVTIKNGIVDNSNSNLSAVWSSGDLTLDGVSVSSARHAVRIEGGKAVIDGESYAVKGTAGMTTHALNVSGGASVTVYGGEFSGPAETDGDSGAAVNVQDTSSVVIYGGTFQKGKNGTLSADGAATLSLRGGTYDQEPASAYVAPGYEVSADEAQTWWTVAAPYVPPVAGGGEAAACGPEAACNAFNDVDAGAWYHEVIDWAYANGILRGYDDGSGNVGPEDATLRSHVMAMLHRMAGEPAAAADPGFNDVAEGAWYYEAVAWAKSVGLTTGYADGSGNFGPNDVMTREQMATVLYRFAALNGVDVSVGEDTNNLSYEDFSEISEWAIPAMQWAVGAGIVSGYTDADGEPTGYLGPKDDAERAHFAAMLMRLDAKHGIL